MRRRDWINRIKGVERQYAAAQHAADYCWGHLASGRSRLPHGIQHHDFTLMRNHLQGTYLIRLFAEFETGLRHCWRATRRKDPPLRTMDLLNGFISKRSIPAQIHQLPHVVREYRNALIHERDEPAPAIGVADACGILCRFFSYLPPNW